MKKGEKIFSTSVKKEREEKKDWIIMKEREINRMYEKKGDTCINGKEKERGREKKQIETERERERKGQKGKYLHSSRG